MPAWAEKGYEKTTITEALYTMEIVTRTFIL